MGKWVLGVLATAAVVAVQANAATGAGVVGNTDWLDGGFRNPNWRWNRIGVPPPFGTVALLMDDILSAVERARVEKRIGSWKDSMEELGDEKVSGRVFEIVIPHGRHSAGASCSWRVRPLHKEER